MSSYPSHNVEIEKRLELLELSIRRQRLGQILFLFIFILLTIGFYFQRQIFSGRLAVINDRAGNIRSHWDKDGLQLQDKDGRTRLELIVPETGSAYLNIKDATGASRALLDDSGVIFNDARGQAKAGLFVITGKDSGAGYIMLFDAKGRPISDTNRRIPPGFPQPPK